MRENNNPIPTKRDVEILLTSIQDELNIYQDLLVRWNAKLNLIGPSTIDDIYQRHFMDSGQLALFFNTASIWSDLGTGAGFPGLVISLIQQQRGHGVMKLFESDQRKVAFLREVSRETNAPVEIIHQRCEHSPELKKSEIIVSRAMAPMSKLAALCAKALGEGAVCGFLKGHNHIQELTTLGADPTLDIEILPSLIRKGGVIVRLRRSPPIATI